VLWRLVDVRANRYGDERLAHLLRLLRPAPRDWITKAQRIFFDLSTSGHAHAAEMRLTDGDLVVLRHALDDSAFRERFDVDPIAAVQAAELHDLALRLASELRELVALAERIATDDVYRAELNTDPVAALVAVGMPATTAEPLLQALAVPEGVLAKLPEVVAHQHEQPPIKAPLIITLLESTAVVEAIRSRARRA
jgi:putative modified peptide